MLRQIVLFFLIGLGISSAYATVNMGPWAVAYLHGWMTDNNIQLCITERMKFTHSSLDAIELSYELSPQNILRRLLHRVVSTVEIAGLVGYRNDQRGSIYEFNPYVVVRWQHFPWDKYLVNTFAFGEGLSFATKSTLREVNDAKFRHHSAKPILNYLMLETTFALPSHPEWQLLARLHHRCGAWGLFGAGNVSSNVIAVGLRYRF